MIEYTKELRKFVAPEIITGLDARLMIERYLYHFGSKNPMVVTDGDLISFSWFKDIIKIIEGSVEHYILYKNVTSNPKDTEVMEGAEIFIREKCDLLIAIGGGSPIDCAKGISIVSANGGNILDYEGVDEIAFPGPPLICIPTTSGASADVSQFAIILDTSSKIKKAIISKKVVPDLALLDVVPLTTMDSYLTACTAMDALTHAIEAYVSNANSPLSDVHALEAIRLIHKNIRQSILPDRTYDTLYGMMLGSLHAGLAFSNASLGLVHAIAHSLGGYFDFPHGECNSILLEHVIGFNFESASDRYKKIAEQLDINIDSKSDSEIKEALQQYIARLRESLFIHATKEINSTDEVYKTLAQSALDDPCILTNPRTVTQDDIMKILHRVLV